MVFAALQVPGPPGLMGCRVERPLRSGSIFKEVPLTSLLPQDSLHGCSVGQMGLRLSSN